ncbi:MAG: MurR/RpiR family transcriptional regulator [Armatimonadetes bacterium]|nr:MurR/RpiR family transcriptional regulator [Armatimonadota bacterium]
MADLAQGTKGNCLSRIQSLAGGNQKGIMRIAGYVLANPEEVVSLTILELAEKANAGIATVNRFCAKLGYESYRAFQVDLSASLAQNQSAISDVFHPGDDPSTIIERVFEINKSSLADTKALLNDADIIEVARLVTAARKVFFVGVGGSGLLARLGALRLESLGMMALAITDPFDGIFTLSNTTQEDVVIGISHTGSSEIVLKLVTFAKEKGARTVGIVNYVDSPLAKLCEFPLYTSFRERRINAAVSSSRIAQMCILDVIYFLAAYYKGEEAEHLAEEAEAVAMRLFRASRTTRRRRRKGD